MDFFLFDLIIHDYIFILILHFSFLIFGQWRQQQVIISCRLSSSIILLVEIRQKNRTSEKHDAALAAGSGKIPMPRPISKSIGPKITKLV